MILTPAIISEAEAYLCKADKKLARIINQFGPCKLTPHERSPYEALVRAIAHQQLHGKAAETILSRFLGLYGGKFPSPRQVLESSLEDLRGVGFSHNKVLAIQDIARKTLDDIVPSSAEAARLTDMMLVERLVTIRGVGRWTVEMLLIFTLGRPDVFPVDDYGIKAGVQHLYKYPEPPQRQLMLEKSIAWQPYRSVVAWYLWRLADSLKVQK